MRSAFAAVLCALAATPAFADSKSEAAAADLLHRRLQNESPEDAALLRSVHGKLVVVVRGSMDQIENVLRAARIEHTLIAPQEVAGLKNVIEKAFPGTIAHNGRSTSDELVPVTIDHQGDNLMSRMLLRKSARPQWWLEGSSYPIKILDKKRVEVLAHSDEMRIRYGAAPVVVRFRWEDGEVIHVVSHFYRQLDARGPQIAAATAVQSYEGLSAKDKKELAQTPAMAGAAADVESSYAFQRMTANLVAGKQRTNKSLEKKYGQTVKGSVQLRAAPALDAPSIATERHGVRMRVLEKKGDQVKVRDEEGNEGWMPADAAVAF